MRPAPRTFLIAPGAANCLTSLDPRSYPVPRFVILQHDHPTLHWDLMLETGGVLRTWRLAGPPSPGSAVAAEPLGDHRILYLDYEGPVSGNRGTVRRWDAGTYSGLTQQAEVTEFELVGGIVLGHCEISRHDGGRWQCVLAPPGTAKPPRTI